MAGNPKPSNGFKKGQSGNPAGRAKPTADELDLRAAARLKAPEALLTIVRLMEQSDNDGVRLKAAEIVLDRGYGKAPQMVDLNVKRHANELNDAELHAIASGARVALEAISEAEPDRIYAVHKPALPTGTAS